MRKPIFRGLSNGDACASCGVNALLNFVKCIHFPGFGIFLGVECLEVAFAVLVPVIDDPRLFI
jgi:hypothetical protein